MATEAAHGAEAAGTGVFPPFDPTFFPSQLFWLAITFIAFYFVMKRLAIPQIGDILADRKGRIASDLAAAERLKGETDDAMASYEQALTAARGRAYKIAEEANEKAGAETAKSRATIEADLAAKMAAADQRIADIKSRALAEVGTIASDTADAVVARLLGGATDKREIEAAVSAAMAGKAKANA